MNWFPNISPLALLEKHQGNPLPTSFFFSYKLITLKFKSTSFLKKIVSTNEVLVILRVMHRFSHKHLFSLILPDLQQK